MKPILKPILKVKPKIALLRFPLKAKEIFKLKEPKPFYRPKGYVAQMKRFGKWKLISPVVKRGEALWFGERAARKTLGATFRIGKVAAPISKRRYPSIARPSPKIFRPYRIVKGRKVPLVETWIQKRGKRLMTGSERAEIQAAKKSAKLFSWRKKKSK